MRKPTMIALLTGCLVTAGASLLAQQSVKRVRPESQDSSAGETIRIAMSAGPTDITKNAAVVTPGTNGQMTQLRAGTNGWVCMAGAKPMCVDKEWQNYLDAYAKKETPHINGIGISYMLQGDHGVSNTDPFATGPTPVNQWVVSPSHVMIITPDVKQLDVMTTDPYNGGPWVMWKGTKYAHIMVPMVPMPAQEAIDRSAIPPRR